MKSDSSLQRTSGQRRRATHWPATIGLLALLAPAAAAEPTAPPEVTFVMLPTDEPATSMATTEDGRQLLMTHQGANRISVWDVRQEKVTQTVETTSPRTLLVRGNRAFVVNSGEATITVLTRTDAWRPTAQLIVEKPGIVHLSAPQGKHFKDELIVTCHGPGSQASYQDSHIFRLDVARNRDKQIAKSTLAQVSYDGKLVIVQGSFNLSPAGPIVAIAYDDFVAGRMTPVYRYGENYLPWLFQLHEGSYWIGSRMIVGGVPAKTLHDAQENLLVPDLSQRLVYELSQTRLTAKKLDVRFTELDRRKAAWPDEVVKEWGRVSQPLYRSRGYLLDHPVAFTHGDTLYLFVLDYGTNTVLWAKTAGFARP